MDQKKYEAGLETKLIAGASAVGFLEGLVKGAPRRPGHEEIKRIVALWDKGREECLEAVLGHE